MALTQEQVAEYRNKYSIGSSQRKKPEDEYSLREAGGDVLETIKGVGSEMWKAGEKINESAQKYDVHVSPGENVARNFTSAGAGIFGGLANVAAKVVTGVGKVLLPQSAENKVADVVGQAAQALANTGVARDVIETYKSLPPEQQDQVNNALSYLDGLTTIVTAGQAKTIVSNMINNAKTRVVGAAESVANAAKNTTSNALNKISTTGVGQILKEGAERVPRAFERGRDAVQEAAVRAEKIKASSPAVQTAIKSGVDERIINTLAQADTPTAKAYKEMVDIASAPQSTIKPKQQPSIVAGKAAESTFDILEKERKRIGSALNDEIASLPTGTYADMRLSMRQLKTTLADNGIKTTRDGALSFAGKYTPAERARIQELWKVVNEVPEKMTAKQIRDMDQLLSKLQRETRMEGLQDIIVDVGNENKNLFQVFREQYTNQLENINPRIRALNREYRQARVLIDDLEDTIFKSGKYDSIKGVDQSEFAKVNLRRIMGEAQSSPAYAEILSKMDARARELGYTGARADDLIYFAEELRKLYPDTIPKTGFQGGIRNALAHPIDTLTSAGAPDIGDQQKAIRDILDEMISIAENQRSSVPQK